MKQIILFLTVFLAMSAASAQEVFKLGTTVKGKHVTYEVKQIGVINKRLGDSFPTWIVCNVHNPDTVLKEIPYRGVAKKSFFADLQMQIGAILHDHLSEEEVDTLNKKRELFEVLLRVDSTKHKLLQVTCFMFDNEYIAAQNRIKRGIQCAKVPVAYDGFWLNFDPDRLYAIERDIVKRLVLPEDTPETYLLDDFEVAIHPLDILDLEAAKAKRAAEEAEWKAFRERKF